MTRSRWLHFSQIQKFLQNRVPYSNLTLKLVVVQLAVVEASDDGGSVDGDGDDVDGNDDEVVDVVVVVIVVESNCMAEDSSSIGTQPTVVAAF